MPTSQTARVPARPEPPFVALSPGLTPGAYMRQCRRAAGLTVAQCANAVTLRGSARIRAQDAIRALEANRPGDYGRIVSALRDRRVFAFDFGLFATLAAETADPDMPEGIRW
jgi:hypothetical protein